MSFDKATAIPDIAVTGGAADDPGFTDKGSTVRYVVSTGAAAGPFKAEAELWYQPIGFRWAHNLAPYKASEPQRWCGTTKRRLGNQPLSWHRRRRP